MADLTTDIAATVGLWSLNGFKPSMPTVLGTTALVHRLCVRLQTRRGKFPWWPNFGTRVADYLLSKIPPQQIASDVKAECMKDEQVSSCNVAATIEDSGRLVRLEIEIEASTGPFKLSLAITQAKLDLIALQLSRAA